MSQQLTIVAEIAANDRPATLVDWWAAPEWLTVVDACRLIGREPAVVMEIIAAGGVETIKAYGETLLNKTDLREVWEIACELSGP